MSATNISQHFVHIDNSVILPFTMLSLKMSRQILIVQEHERGEHGGILDNQHLLIDSFHDTVVIGPR